MKKNTTTQTNYEGDMLLVISTYDKSITTHSLQTRLGEWVGQSLAPPGLLLAGRTPQSFPA